MARPLADPAVGDRLVAGLQPLLLEVDGLQLVAALERAVLGGRPAPGDVRGAGDVAGPHGRLGRRVARGVRDLADKLGRAPDVDHRPALLHVGQDVVAQGPDLGAPLAGRVVGAGVVRGVGREHAALGLPLGPAAVHDPAVLVPEHGERPEGVARPPVRLVAVEHERRVGRDPEARAQPLELADADRVADVGVLEVRLPVDVDGAGDVAGRVEQDVLVGLDDPDVLGVGEVLGDPVGGDQDLGAGVLGHAEGEDAAGGRGVTGPTYTAGPTRPGG